MNLETLTFVPQTTEMQSAWQWPIQYDEHVGVFYEEEFVPEKNEDDTTTGTIKAVWVDEKGRVQTELIVETEHIVEANISESIAVGRAGNIVSLVEKYATEEAENSGSNKWSLVFYQGNK